MRVTEDGMQDARLALLERGGPSAIVENPGLVVTMSRRLAADDARRHMMDKEANYRLLGLHYDRWASWSSERNAAARDRTTLRGRETPEQRSEHSRKAAAVASRLRTERAALVTPEVLNERRLRINANRRRRAALKREKQAA